MSYALKMQAGCFEECETPESLPHKNFIDMIKSFLVQCPNEQLIVNLLTGNNRLVNHKEVEVVFIDQIRHHQKQQQKVLEILRQLAERGQTLPPKAMKALTASLTDPDRRHCQNRSRWNFRSCGSKRTSLATQGP